MSRKFLLKEIEEGETFLSTFNPYIIDEEELKRRLWEYHSRIDIDHWEMALIKLTAPEPEQKDEVVQCNHQIKISDLTLYCTKEKGHNGPHVNEEKGHFWGWMPRD
jgi:hypothetical protein